MSIQKLPSHVIHQIAAGEVIERPASVAKELMENSLDAGANRLRIEFEGGGIDRLCVEDDGQGVTKEELPLVFESHATSKLRQLEDLAHIQSMGFRGEAISSIASVAELDFCTQAKGQSHAHRAISSFGRWQGISEESARVGSRVEIRRLFEKLPVRHKFLKSPQSEGRRITQMFKQYALAHPDKHFILSEPEKKRVTEFTPSSGFERALQFFDHEAQEDKWFHFAAERNAWKIQFAFLQPRYFQKSRQKLQMFLNRRPIQDKQMEFAVGRAFEGYTEYPRYAQGVLWIEGDPDRFDVNVHPCKTEVRFLDADSLFSAIVHLIRDKISGLHRSSEEMPLQTEGEAQPPVSSQQWPHRIEVRPAHRLSQSSMGSEPSSFANSAHPIDKTSKPPIELDVFKNNSPSSARLWKSDTRYEFIGHLEKTYLLTKRDERLFVFDQHALHERILYERWIQDIKKNGKLGSQRLLFPQTFKAANLESLLEYESDLEKLGIELQAYPGRGVQVRAAPAELKESLGQVLEQLSQSFENAKESLFREQIATMACHSAIRAHDRVDEEVARRWFEQFDSEDALGHCPHGRPTFVELSPRDFEKFFHRT